MVLENFGSELQELTFEQASDVNGGESLWYWIGYGVGAVAHGVAAFVEGASAGSGPGWPPR